MVKVHDRAQLLLALRSGCGNTGILPELKAPTLFGDVRLAKEVRHRLDGNACAVNCKLNRCLIIGVWLGATLTKGQCHEEGSLDRNVRHHIVAPLMCLVCNQIKLSSTSSHRCSVNLISCTE